MKYILLIINFLLITNTWLFSQEEYALVKAQGIIPEEIIEMNKIIYNSAKDTVKGNYSERQDKREFLLRSNYELGNLLKSGKILFGDRFTNYVQKVGDVLLENHPELKSNIKFYVVKSPEVNAYSTQQGYLFVNLGLLAQVENEAQLAFVLAHELIHYTEKHNIESFLEVKKIERNQGNYSNLSADEQKGYFLKYSKEHEMEADRKGFEDFYLKSGYDVNEALSVFDVLLYSYLPVDELEFDTTFFDDKHFKIDYDYFLDECDPITAVEDYDDSEHYHPNIKKRREHFIDYVIENDVKEGEKYLYSEAEFLKIQRDARYELSNLHAVNTNYCSAIYNSYLLLKKNEDNLFLKRNIAYSLYALSRYKNHKTVRDVIPSEKKVEGKSQQVYRLFNKIRRKELNILALKYNWNLYKSTKDPQFERQYKDLLHDLVYHNKMYYNTFYKTAKDTADVFVEISQEEYNKLSKYAKIKYDKKKAALKENKGNGIETYLIDVLADDAFSEEFRTLSVQAKKEQDEPVKNTNKNGKRRLKTIDNSVDNILVANPLFLKMDNLYKYMYIESEERERAFIEMLYSVGGKAQLDINVLDVFTIKNTDVEKFNQIALLNSWISEFVKHQDFNDLWNIHCYQDPFLRDVLKENSNRYFAFSGTFVKEHPQKFMLQYFFAIDSESGEVILTNFSNIKSVDYDAPIKSFLYDCFINLKRTY